MSTVVAHPWKVLIVSEDRSLLRGLSRFLDVFGYEVSQAADALQAFAAWEARRPDFLILDGPPALQRSLQRCMTTRVMGETLKVHTFLLVEEGVGSDPAAALAAGVDDFLSKPCDYGELLARLQAGARTLEFERRWRTLSATHSLTGLMTRAALLNRMRQVRAQSENADRWCACAVLDLDYFDRINQMYGVAAGDHLLCSIAERLQRHCTGNESLACLGADCFGVFLPGMNDNEAAAWAEPLRRELAQAEFTWENAVLRITASIGVAAAKGRSLTPEDLLDTASKALKFAKNSGRDYVARYREFDDETRAWTDLAAPGRLFERTVARDVMIPCPVTLAASDPLLVAVARFRRTQFAALPVVDSDGQLKGMLLEETVFDELSEERLRTATVADAMITDPPRFEETTKVGQLLDFFARPSSPAALITHHGRPTGLVTRQTLATLTNAITTASFLPEDDDQSVGDFLVVPELCPAGE